MRDTGHVEKDMLFYPSEECVHHDEAEVVQQGIQASGSGTGGEAGIQSGRGVSGKSLGDSIQALRQSGELFEGDQTKDQSRPSRRTVACGWRTKSYKSQGDCAILGNLI